MTHYFATNDEGKPLCENCNYYPIVGECDEPRRWLCRICMEQSYEDAEGDIIEDDSLIFCSTEWDRQQVS